MIRAKCGRSREVGSIFQFTPPRGGRRRGAALQPAEPYFNSRSRVGGDTPPSDSIVLPSKFQFTPPRGGRQQIYIKVCVCICAKWEVKGWGSIFCRQVNRFSCNCCIIYCVPCKKCNHFSAPTHRKIMWEGGRRKAAYNNRGSPVCTGPVLPMVSTRFL